MFSGNYFRSVEKATTISKRIRKEEGRRTCGGKAEVSVFDFNKPEQIAILFLWSGCFQNPRESAAGFGVCERSREKLQAGHCPKQSPKPRNVLSRVESLSQRICGKLEQGTAQGAMPDSSIRGRGELCAGLCPRQHASEFKGLWEAATKDGNPTTDDQVGRPQPVSHRLRVP